MKTFSFKDINSWNPCYDPTRYLPEDWSGTVLDILDHKEIPFQDKLWCIMRPELVSNKLMRLFAVWCARQVQHLMKDERSLKALDIAEAFANGLATQKELDAAWYTAWAAAQDAARAAAWAAATAAARDAARAAAWAAATAAARDAARDSQQTKLREMILAGIETGDVK